MRYCEEDHQQFAEGNLSRVERDFDRFALSDLPALTIS